MDPARWAEHSAQLMVVTDAALWWPEGPWEDGERWGPGLVSWGHAGCQSSSAPPSQAWGGLDGAVR